MKYMLRTLAYKQFFTFLLGTTASLLFCNNVYGQSYPLGEGDFDSVQESAVYMIRFSENKYPNLKDYVNLSNLMPPAGDQGEQGSCWAWATTYGLRSSMDKHQSYVSKDNTLDSEKVYSPAYTYSLYKGSRDANDPSNDCKFSNYSASILDSILKNGVVTMKQLKGTKCINDIDGITQYSYSRKLQGYNVAYGDDLHSMKKVLSDGQPVVLSMRVDEYFSTRGNINRTNPRWRVAQGRRAGSHAMVCVGYDSTSILVFNSWGKDFGVDGFAWIDNSLVIQGMNYFCYPEKTPFNDELPTTTKPKPVREGTNNLVEKGVDTAWFKEGYFVPFDNLKIALADLSKQKHYAVIEVRDLDYKLIKSMYIKEGTEAEFTVATKKYNFNFLEISPAGNPFNFFHRNAVHFIISRSKKMD